MATRAARPTRAARTLKSHQFQRLVRRLEVAPMIAPTIGPSVSSSTRLPGFLVAELDMCLVYAIGFFGTCTIRAYGFIYGAGYGCQ
jgi:hypothetical protein